METKTRKTKTEKADKPAEKKRLPDNLEEWLYTAQSDESKQLIIHPPDKSLGDAGARVRKGIGNDDCPCWLGYPMVRAEIASIREVSQKGATTYVNRVIVDPINLTLRTLTREISMTAIAFDPKSKCAVYVMDEVYDVPKNWQLLTLTGKVVPADNEGWE